MNPMRVKAYCDRCGSRLLYNACRFRNGQVFKRFMCAECGRRRTVAQVLQAHGRRQGTPAQLALSLAPQRQPGVVEKSRS